MSPIRSTVRKFIAETFFVPEDSFADDASLVQSGIIDSTGVLEVVAFLERSFAIRVQDTELIPENLDTVEAMVAMVSRKSSAAA